MGMDVWQEFRGLNAAYVAELYERYRRDPASVDPATRAIFEQSPPPLEELAPESGAESVAAASRFEIQKIVGAVNLAESIRKFGHLGAQLDPLGSKPPGDPSLSPQFHGVNEDDLRRLPASLVVGLCDSCGDSSAWDAIERLRKVYCSTTGHDYAHLRDPEEREWLRAAAEQGLFRPPKDPINEVALLERITQEGVFELFVHRTFPGKTRFRSRASAFLFR